MKWYCVFLACAAFHMCNAQMAKPFSPVSYITPYRLEVTCNKTTNLVFPANITMVDRGSLDVIVEKATESVLRVKADQKNFAETNLSVITTDGRLYSFIVNYSDHPAYLNINIQKAFETTTQNQSNLDSIAGYAGVLLQQNQATVIRRARCYKLRLSLRRFYVKDDIIYCRMSVQNQTNINYQVDQLRFSVIDDRETKRTAVQQVEIEPLFVSGYTGAIGANSIKEIVVALPKFTLSRGKRLVISVSEKNGSRNLRLEVKSQQILRASIM